MKNAIQNFKLIALAVILSFGLNLAYAWVLPTEAPPNGNADAPLTTGTALQIKRGSLTIGTPTEPGTLSITKLAVLNSAGIPVAPAPGQVLAFRTPSETNPSNVEWVPQIGGPGGGGGTLAPRITLTAPASISSGTAGDITWSVTGATTCTGSRTPVGSAWTGPRDATGGTSNFVFVIDNEMTRESQPFTFSLTCTGGGVTSTEQAIVTVAARCLSGQKVYDRTDVFEITPQIAACGVMNVEAWGGGGGSGAAAHSRHTETTSGAPIIYDSWSGGGGGGSGAYARQDNIPTSGRSGDVISVTIGAGGLGGPKLSPWPSDFYAISPQYGASGGVTSFRGSVGTYVRAGGGSAGKNFDRIASDGYYLECLARGRTEFRAPGGVVDIGGAGSSNGNAGNRCLGESGGPVQGSAGGVGVLGQSGIRAGAGGAFSSKNNFPGKTGSPGAVRIWWKL